VRGKEVVGDFGHLSSCEKESVENSYFLLACCSLVIESADLGASRSEENVPYATTWWEEGSNHSSHQKITPPPLGD